MELTLKLLTGRNAGREIKVSAAKFLIGRADDCHLRPHSDMISRHHCVVLVEEGFCAVRDLASRNGTFVNGEQVVGQRELHNGDQLKVAHLEFEVQLTSRVGGKSRSKVKSVKEAAQRTATSKSPPGSDEDEISDWLSDEGADDKSETHEMQLAETRTPPHETPAPDTARETIFLKSPTEETIASDELELKPLEDEVKARPAAEKPGVPGAAAAKRLFGGGAKPGGGKPGGSPSSGHKDSREAAADALKKLFTNRKP